MVSVNSAFLAFKNQIISCALDLIGAQRLLKSEIHLGWYPKWAGQLAYFSKRKKFNLAFCVVCTFVF